MKHHKRAHNGKDRVTGGVVKTHPKNEGKKQRSRGATTRKPAMMLLSRQVWWSTMKTDIGKWCDKCLTCIQFRKVPQKQETVPTVPTNQDCWEIVMVDMEEPSNPADKNGCKYVMTYI